MTISFSRTLVFSCVWVTSILVFSSMAQAQQQRQLTVNGRASINAVPDLFNATFTVEQTGPVVTKLAERVNHDTNAILAFLIEQGLDEKDISAMQVNLRPVYRRVQGGEAEQSGVNLSRTVQVVIRDLQNYAPLLDGVLKRGVSGVNSFQAQISDPDQLYRQALAAAIEDAKTQAAAMAKQMNVTLGHLLQAEEASSPPRLYNHQVAGGAARSFAESGAVYVPGSQEISASVRLVYAIE